MSTGQLNLRGQGQSIPVNNQIIPEEGPKTIPVLFDFTTNASWLLDLLQQVQGTKFSFVQNIFIDNSQNANSITVVPDQSNQRVIAQAYSQGYYSIFVPNAPKFTITSGVSAVVVPIYFSNMPVAPAVWKTSLLGTQAVSDAALDATVVGNTQQIIPWAWTNADVAKQRWTADRWVTNVDFIANTSIAILAGAPGWFLTDMTIGVSPGTAVAAGALITVQVRENAIVLWQGKFYAPAAALTTQLTVPPLVSLSGLNVNSKVSGSTLNLIMSAAVTSGGLFYNFGCGTTNVVT